MEHKGENEEILEIARAGWFGEEVVISIRDRAENPTEGMQFNCDINVAQDIIDDIQKCINTIKDIRLND